MQVFTSEQTQCKRKNIRINVTHATLIQFYFIPDRRLPTSIYTKPIKEKKERSCDFPFRVVLVDPLVRAESWQNGRAFCLDRAVSGLRADRLGPCSPFLVVDDSREGCADSRAEGERSTKRHDQGPTARARTPAREKKNGTRIRNTEAFHPHARQREEEEAVHPRASAPRESTNRSCSSLL